MSARLSRLGKRTFAILAAAGLAAPEAARAGGFRVFESTAVLGRSAAGRAPEEFTLAGCCDGVLDEGHGPGSFRLDLRFPPTLSLDTDSGGLLGPPRLQPLRPEPRRFFITIASVGAVAGSALNSFTDGPHESFHFTNEGYFGRNTYAGGGDKASHIVSYYGVSRLLASVYEVFDLSEEKSYTLASGVSVLTGFATELGKHLPETTILLKELLALTAS